MASLYREIGTSRQSISQMNVRDKKRDAVEEKILKIVKEWRINHPRMGSRSLYYTIQNIGGIELEIGVNKFEKLMSSSGLTINHPVKKWVKTSDGLGKERYKNLINGKQLDCVNQVIAGDITYFDLNGEWAYIFTLKDIYSQRLLGLVPSLSIDTKAALSCLKDAIEIRKEVSLKGCIHHTDNGSQYNANEYKIRLRSEGMLISRAKNCIENGSSENLNGLIKNSYLKFWSINTFEQLKQACKEIIYLANEQRAVEELGYLSPVQYEKIILQLNKKERPVKVLYDFEK